MSSKYSGMTVNERLFVAGSLEEFEKAVKENDVEKAIAVLRLVELPDSAIKSILESVCLKSQGDNLAPFL